MAAIAFAFVFSLANGAQAGMVLLLDDLATPGVIDVIILDEALAGVSTAFGNSTAADTAGPVGDGEITFVGSMGVFTFTISAAQSKPHLDEAEIDLLFAVTSSAAGTIRITHTDTDFASLAGASATFVSAIGGTTQGTVAYEQYIDFGNIENSKNDSQISLGPIFTTTVTSVVPGLAGDFSESISIPLAPTNSAFSMVQVIEIHHDGVAVSSGNANALIIIPLPGSVWSAVAMMAGIGLISKYRRRAKHLKLPA